MLVANNGKQVVFDMKPEDFKVAEAPRNEKEKGVLAHWDGKTWKIIQQRQFTDVT
ncbi:hypothetical protein [Flavobacterium sp. FlaQc-48]|uniref:hypothetical protein n=1 Tax=Flavobacterium sp. FlaQc-48 TaxID=3374181 RepID=UPI00375649D9